MNKIEISAKNVDEALTQAMLKLGINSDRLEYEVISEGRSGFFGIGSKPAVIKAWIKEDALSEELKSFMEPSVKEEKVSEMSYEELLKVIQVYHLETSDIYSQKLEELYIDVKNSEISFTEKDSIKTLITNMDSAYQSFLAVYADLVDSLKTLSGNLENLRYNLLVDPNSDYQKAVNEVNNAKLELNALKQEIANLESPSVIKVIAGISPHMCIRSKAKQNSSIYNNP